MDLSKAVAALALAMAAILLTDYARTAERDSVEAPLVHEPGSEP